MSGEVFQAPAGRSCSRTLHGEVLEIGFGTGLNLPHYPSNGFADFDASILPVSFHRCERERRRRPFLFTLSSVTAESLPYPERRFDSIVSTWTLCTIPDPLKPFARSDGCSNLRACFSFLSMDAATSAYRGLAGSTQSHPKHHRMRMPSEPSDRSADRSEADSTSRTSAAFRFRMCHASSGEMYQGHGAPIRGLKRDALQRAVQ